MVCGRVSNLLSAYLDQELGGTEMLSIRSHVAGCPRCREEREALMQVRRLLYSLPTVQPPSGGEERLIHRYERRVASCELRVVSCRTEVQNSKLKTQNSKLATAIAALLPARFAWGPIGAAASVAVIGLVVGLAWAGWQQPQHPDTVLAMVRPGLTFSSSSETGRGLPAGYWHADRFDGSPRWTAGRAQHDFTPIRWTPAENSVEIASPVFRQANWENR